MSSETAVDKSPVGATSTASRSMTVFLAAGAAYAAILLCVWGPFARTTGMGWETYFILTSEATHSWRNFLYLPDPLRIHQSNFYELAYRMGEAMGIRGSFFPFELVYACLWWARSALAFLLLRRLVPNSFLLPFTVGAIMLIHAPDYLLGWLGQMHQWGMFLWLLIALYLLVVALQQKRLSRALLSAAGACLFVYMALWTYEIPLFIILVAPVIVMCVLRVRPSRISLLSSALWYVPSAVYVWLSYQRYAHSMGGDYQRSVMRASLDASGILSDWVFNIRYSLSFWAWYPSDAYMPQSQLYLLAAGVVAIFVLVGVFLARLEGRSSAGIARARQLWAVFAAGLIFLALSFPAYLLLQSARIPRRTHLLAAIAAAMVLGAVVALLARVFPLRARAFAAVGLAVPIMWAGAYRAIEREGNHRWEWNVNLQVMRRLLRAVPGVRPGTVVVLTGVPKTPDPFSGSAFWLNNSLQLAFPGTDVSGVYYFEDSTPGPGDNLRLRDGRWEYSGEGVAPPIRAAGVDQTLVLQMDSSERVKVLNSIPEFVCGGRCSGTYDPYGRVVHRAPAREALLRYGPL
ncbi:MAG: hypothetical protein LAQ30_15245 [Acidobacteriia bacterium]|nr:hypothetical protein [Terriglobia bacterium]